MIMEKQSVTKNLPNTIQLLLNQAFNHYHSIIHNSQIWVEVIMVIIINQPMIKAKFHSLLIYTLSTIIIHLNNMMDNKINNQHHIMTVITLMIQIKANSNLLQEVMPIIILVKVFQKSLLILHKMMVVSLIKFLMLTQIKMYKIIAMEVIVDKI